MLGIYFLFFVSLIEEVQAKIKLFENVNILWYTFDPGLFTDTSAKNKTLYASRSSITLMSQQLLTVDRKVAD